mmetsp:Transcript_13098/g.33667  ORF Transcript_13098/g.33667 Transcript_13098/m.33667 type:complete len:210 (+) Transcript_13098:291-920(+)
MVLPPLPPVMVLSSLGQTSEQLGHIPSTQGAPVTVFLHSGIFPIPQSGISMHCIQQCISPAAQLSASSCCSRWRCAARMEPGAGWQPVDIAFSGMPAWKAATVWLRYWLKVRPASGPCCSAAPRDGSTMRPNQARPAPSASSKSTSWRGTARPAPSGLSTHACSPSPFMTSRLPGCTTGSTSVPSGSSRKNPRWTPSAPGAAFPVVSST